MCEKCRIYLYDYFEQPIHKENPLYPFVNQKQMKKNIHDLVKFVQHLFQTIAYHRFLDAKSKVENYCTFAIKPENPYQQYDILYTFLRQESTFTKEIQQLEGYLLDLQFLRVPKTDKHCQLLHKWLAFLLGSLYSDMHILHCQHSPNNVWPIDLEKGLPGRPDTAVKLKKKQVEQWIVVDVEEDDLYT